MDSKTKKQAVLCMIGVFIVILIFLAVIGIKRIKKNKEIEAILEAQPILVTVEEETYAEEATKADKEYETPYDLQEDAPCRVMIDNIDDLAKEGLVITGLELLEPYLTQYFDYYLQDGTNYKGVYVEKTFRDDYNFPSFDIYVEELDLNIECIYIIYKQLYHFTSRFNPDGE